MIHTHGNTLFLKPPVLLLITMFLLSLRNFSPVLASRSGTIIHTRSRLSVPLLALLSSPSPFLRRPPPWTDITLIAATLLMMVRLYPAGVAVWKVG